MKNKKGFSLVEIILAVFVSLVGILVVMKSLLASIEHSIESQDHVIATSLAQEGVELVRNVRDENILKGKEAFFHFTTADNCRVDYRLEGQGRFHCGGMSKELRYQNGFYQHQSGENTKFSRKIETTLDGPPATKMTVRSIVIWERSNFPNVTDCHASNQCVYVDLILTDWQ